MGYESCPERSNHTFIVITCIRLQGRYCCVFRHILIEALVLTKETTVIYSGLLKNYEVISDSDQLSYLTLQSPSRRNLRAAQIINKDPNSATELISGYDQNYGPLINIPGNNLTIQGKDIPKRKCNLSGAYDSTNSERSACKKACADYDLNQRSSC